MAKKQRTPEEERAELEGRMRLMRARLQESLLGDRQRMAMLAVLDLATPQSLDVEEYAAAMDEVMNDENDTDYIMIVLGLALLGLSKLRQQRGYNEVPDEKGRPIFLLNEMMDIRQLLSELSEQAITARPMWADQMYLNKYVCECGHRWADVWSSGQRDRCPMCDQETEPTSSEEITV